MSRKERNLGSSPDPRRYSKGTNALYEKAEKIKEKRALLRSTSNPQEIKEKIFDLDTEKTALNEEFNYHMKMKNQFVELKDEEAARGELKLANHKAIGIRILMNDIPDLNYAWARIKRSEELAKMETVFRFDLDNDLVIKLRGSRIAALSSNDMIANLQSVSLEEHVDEDTPRPQRINEADVSFDLEGTSTAAMSVGSLVAKRATRSLSLCENGQSWT